MHPRSLPPPSRGTAWGARTKLQVSEWQVCRGRSGCEQALSPMFAWRLLLVTGDHVRVSEAVGGLGVHDRCAQDLTLVKPGQYSYKIAHGTIMVPQQEMY